MKRIQKQRVDALTAFKNYCDENESVWVTLPAFVTGMIALGVKIQAIISTEGQQEKNNKGVTHTKNKTKSLMAGTAAIISEALQGYATAVGDMTMFSLMQISFTDIYKAKNSEAVSKAELISATAASVLTSAGDYGINQNVIDALNSIVSDYKDVESSTRNVVTDRVTYTKNITTLISEANTIMRKILLKLGRQFIAANPDFYTGMVNSAKVITTVVHTKLKLTVTNAGDFENPLVGCTVQIENTTLAGETSATGKCTISSVPEGKQNIIMSKPGYVTMRKEQVQFNRGKSTTMTVSLTPDFVMPAVTMSKSKVNA